VLIRCRPGDFVYGPAEIEAMLESIAEAKVLGVDGVAVGCLTAEDRIDARASATLIDAARPLSVTFHRAFDRVPPAGIAGLGRLGVDRVLTSGGAATAEQGTARLRALVAEPVRVIAAGSVRAHNVGGIVRATGVREVHAAVRRLTRDPSPKAMAMAVATLRLAANAGDVPLSRPAPGGRW
jgi:copper homeostasis protein